MAITKNIYLCPMNQDQVECCLCGDVVEALSILEHNKICRANIPEGNGIREQIFRRGDFENSRTVFGIKDLEDMVTAIRQNAVNNNLLSK